MKLDIPTIVFITGIVLATLSIAVFVQYKLNKNYNGLGWLLLGAVIAATGFFLMFALTIQSVRSLSFCANSMVVAGQIFLGIGVKKFLGKRKCGRVFLLLYASFLACYAFFYFVRNSVFWCGLVLSVSSSLILLKTAWILFREKTGRFSQSACFIASLLFTYSIIQVFLSFASFAVPSIKFYIAHNAPQFYALSNIVTLVFTVLLTFGFIIMVNQRLNADKIEDSEKMQTLFNMSPNAQLIFRISDYRFVDVNAGFLSMTGYTREELVGKSLNELVLWHSADDREKYEAELKRTGSVTNSEYYFFRKNRDLFIGSISAKVINFHGQKHLVNSIQDVTERIISAQKIQELVQRLEAEKKTAQQNAITDCLTGLMNRRHFDESLKKEFFRLNRSGAPLSLIILDIDHFKQYNDSYGHLAGDNCLRQIGSVLKKSVKRLSDVVARYGGEEFVVIMPETESCGAIALAEQIRKNVEAMVIPHAISPVAAYITVSVGVVTAYTSDMKNPEQIIALADKALYDAKHGGRNQITVATVGNDTVQEQL